MPQTVLGKKRLRQCEKRRVYNRSIKTRTRSIIKKLRTAVEAKDVETAEKLLPEVYKDIDKAVAKGVLKKGTASRNKSRLTTAVNKLKAAVSAES